MVAMTSEQKWGRDGFDESSGVKPILRGRGKALNELYNKSIKHSTHYFTYYQAHRCHWKQG